MRKMLSICDCSTKCIRKTHGNTPIQASNCFSKNCVIRTIISCLIAKGRDAASMDEFYVRWRVEHRLPWACGSTCSNKARNFRGSKRRAVSKAPQISRLRASPTWYQISHPSPCVSSHLSSRSRSTSVLEVQGSCYDKRGWSLDARFGQDS